MKIDRYITGFILFLLSFSGYGQELKISFEEMWYITLENNIQIRNANILVDRSDYMKKTAWDFGALDFDFTRGQQNTEVVDNFYTIEQGLGSPFTISATKKYFESEKSFYQKNKEMIAKRIKRQLQGLYNSWLFEYELISILDGTLSLLEKSADYARLRYETGESNLLSSAMLTSEYQRMVIEKNLHEVHLNSLENDIRTIVNTDSIIIPVETKLTKLEIDLPDKPEFKIDSVPDVKAMQKYVAVADRNYRLVKSQMSPSFRAGYYNQEIDLIPGYQGVNVGLSFPLLFMPQKGRKQAAQLDLFMAENQYEYQKINAKLQLEKLFQQYEQLKANIEYHEEERLSNALMIEDNANILYEEGEIGYIEFTQNLKTSRQIREDYLNLIREYNLIVIELFYYLEN
jgi:cobalt-zinc-cadmium resistance protein CzcA